MPEHLTLHELVFKKPAGTSRGILHTKPSWIYEYALPNGKTAQTEFPIIPGLSPEFQNHEQYEKALKIFIAEAQPHFESWSQSDFFSNRVFQNFINNWQAYPSFIFGLEIFLNLEYPSQWSSCLISEFFYAWSIAHTNQRLGLDG